MIRLTRIGAIGLISTVLAALGAETGRLPADQLAKAVRSDSISIPTPGELFAALEKPGKALGVSQHLLSRGNSINEFAENNEWDTLQEELEATQNEVKSSMQSHSDQDLVILVTLGGWIRGTQVVTSAIVQNYNEQSAKVLRQPALVHFMQSRINEISPELRNEPLVKDVSNELAKIEKLVSFPENKTPDLEQVRKVNQAVGKMMEAIESKEAPK